MAHLVYILPGKTFQLIDDENELVAIQNTPGVRDAYIVVYHKADNHTKQNYERAQK